MVPTHGSAPRPAATPHSAQRRGRSLFDDLLMTFSIVILEAVAVVVILYATAIAAWGHNKSYAGSPNPPDSGPLGPAGGPALIALAVIAAVAALAAYALYRSRTPIAATSQALVATALTLLITAALAADHHATHPTPPPTSDYDGPAAQCRSGGDTSECPGG